MRRLRHAPGRRRSEGFAALLVLAVVVLVGSVSAYAVRLVTSAQNGVTREILHARAAEAARAGLEWGRWRVQVPTAPLCAPSQTLANLPGTLAPYRVTVRCVAGAPRPEGGASVRAYRISATACNLPTAGACPNLGTSPGADYVQIAEIYTVVR